MAMLLPGNMQTFALSSNTSCTVDEKRGRQREDGEAPPRCPPGAQRVIDAGPFGRRPRRQGGRTRDLLTEVTTLPSKHPQPKQGCPATELWVRPEGGGHCGSPGLPEAPSTSAAEAAPPAGGCPETSCFRASATHRASRGASATRVRGVYRAVPPKATGFAAYTRHISLPFLKERGEQMEPPTTGSHFQKSRLF
ncbi:unnamed protein product [Rangifer tarandus platyrhynchus]|uniref:Uncharacterized protein n=3 Tax=Rangifer tarandus platyrhynchus TaxID=3082113 RepID=A0ABN8XXJ7_RANTA|nr:unnamed protein product [Rangifer tarandus platyrhynchus]CAI9692527.1 unnamed protein product [Rangifer tarandus platyrhynchus]